MKREDVIQLARECGFSVGIGSPALPKFTALIEKAMAELLDSLRALTHSLDPDHFEHDDQREAFKQAVAAIAKATGATHD